MKNLLRRKIQKKMKKIKKNNLKIINIFFTFNIKLQNYY